MTDEDLVKRLRNVVGSCDDVTAEEAADRIEAMVKELNRRAALSIEHVDIARTDSYAIGKADGLREGLEMAAKVCEEIVEYPAGTGGMFEGYGPVRQTRTGGDCASAIRAIDPAGLKEKP